MKIQRGEMESGRLFRGYTRLSHAWYGPVILRQLEDRSEEVNIGIYDCEDGSTVGEFHIAWVDVEDNAAYPKLEVYHDAMEAFNYFADLWKWLGADESRPRGDMTPGDLCAKLDALGIRDITQTERP